MYRIKAFQPSEQYKNYLVAVQERQSRNDLGKERTRALNSDGGWKELIERLDQVTCDGKSVVFKPFYEASNPIFTFDCAQQIIRFPKLKYKLNDRHDETLTISITPCIGDTVRTKLITCPTFSCSLQEFESSLESIKKFFDNGINFTEKIFDIIKNFYVSKINLPNVADLDLIPYCNADLFFIGNKEFVGWVKFAAENNADKMVDFVNNDSISSTGRNILRYLMKADEGYKWYSRSHDSINSVYGVYGKDNYCKVLSVIDSDNTGMFSSGLTSELLTVMDNCGS